MFLLFGLALKSALLLAAVGAAAGYGVYALITRVDDRVEGRRKSAVDISNYMTDIGLPHTSEFFKNYAVGDYDGAYREMSTIASILRDPKQRATVLEGVVSRHLADAVQAKDELRIAQYAKMLGLEVPIGS
jgi:hypothetical protein